MGVSRCPRFHGDFPPSCKILIVKPSDSSLYPLVNWNSYPKWPISSWFTCSSGDFQSLCDSLPEGTSGYWIIFCQSSPRFLRRISKPKPLRQGFDGSDGSGVGSLAQQKWWFFLGEKNGERGKLGSEGSRFRWEAVMFLFNLVIWNVWLFLLIILLNVEVVVTMFGFNEGRFCWGCCGF